MPNLPRPWAGHCALETNYSDGISPAIKKNRVASEFFPSVGVTGVNARGNAPSTGASLKEQTLVVLTLIPVKLNKSHGTQVQIFHPGPAAVSDSEAILIQRIQGPSF